MAPDATLPDDRPMDASQIHLVRKSFALAEPQAEVAGLIFYRRLFEIDPRLRPMFKSDIREQSRKLMEMIAVALALLERPAELTAELEELGAKHAEFGTRTEHYTLVRIALLDMLTEVVGRSFTPETRAAWNQLYDFLETAMLRGAESAAANPSATPSQSHAGGPH